MVRTLFLQQKEFEGLTKGIRIQAVLACCSLSHYRSQTTFRFDFYHRCETASARHAMKNWLTFLTHTVTSLPHQIYWSLSWQLLAHFSDRLLVWGNLTAWRGSSLQSRICTLLGAEAMLFHSYETVEQLVAFLKPDQLPASSPTRAQ